MAFVQKNKRRASSCLICGPVLFFFSSPDLSSPLLFVLFFSPFIYPISAFPQTSGQVTLCNEKFIIEIAPEYSFFGTFYSTPLFIFYPASLQQFPIDL
jgi:hypothetical protein